MTTIQPMHSTADHHVEDQQPMEDIVLLSTPNSTYQSEERDRKAFNAEIHRFMADLGKPLSKIPIMGYKELDLFQLYREVVAHGGFNEVVKNVGTWSKIWKRLSNFDPSITDSSFRLKRNYERYLLEYEFKRFPQHRAQVTETLEKTSLRKSGSNNNLASISRPHSPTALSSNTVSSSSMDLSSTSSNTSSSPSHTTPTSQPRKDKKTKQKKPRRSYSRENVRYSHVDISIESPLSLGDLTLESLGHIIPRYPYVKDNQIFPIGFRSYRYFSSRINPDQQVRYTSQIVDAGDRPQFVLTAMDDQEHPIISFQSPSECWRVVLQHFVNLGEHNSSSDAPFGKLSVSGRLRFGLTHPQVTSLLKSLPNYEKAMDLSGNLSPTSKRKFQSDDSSSADESKMKVHKNSSPFSRSSSFDSMDDLESAIATLQALKYSSA